MKPAKTGERADDGIEGHDYEVDNRLREVNDMPTKLQALAW